MTSKQKHDPGLQKIAKNKLNNPVKMSRADRIAKRAVNNKRDYVTAIDIDHRSGLNY